MAKTKSKASLSATIGDLLRSYKHEGKTGKGKASKKTQKLAVSAAFDMMKKSRGAK